MVLEIAQIGDPVLRDIAPEVPVELITSEGIQSFIDDLIETKRHANGAGLAATQVSVPWRIFVVEIVDNQRFPYKPEIPLIVVINPAISLLTTERFDDYEGCLSIPDLRGVVKRCPEIRVEGYDRQGARLDLIVMGVSAGTYQHADDHLSGVLFQDLVENSKTFCTWQEFHKHHEEGFREQVERLVTRYGS